MKIIDTKKIPADKIIQQTISVLESGALVIFPTETTYGAGVDATNPQALKKLLAFKSRREGKPLSIAVADKQMAEKYVDISSQAENLYRKFLPGPITVVSKARNNLPTGVTSEFNTLGVRIPDYPLVLDILKKFKKPITATSANASGKKRPYKIQDILDNLSQKQKDLIDLVLDAGELPRNAPSTVIDTTLSTPLTLRAGDIVQNMQSGDVQTSTVIDTTLSTPLTLRAGDIVQNMQSGDVQTLQCNVSSIQLQSPSPAETMQIAGKLLLKNWDKISENPKKIIIALDGPLGTGKTVFAKGAGKFLNIEEEISSPTYTYINEYNFQRHSTEGKFYHLDLWKVDSQESFDLLQIPQLVQNDKTKVILIEWWGQVANFAKKRELKPDVIITFSEKNKQRVLDIRE